MPCNKGSRFNVSDLDRTSEDPDELVPKWARERMLLRGGSNVRSECFACV